MKDFSERLRKELAGPLPGKEAQLFMAPSNRLLRDLPQDPGAGTRDAGVLILLYPEGSSFSTVFIQRPDYEGYHGGQISFPGGKREPGDADITETALRESFEEIGFRPSLSEITGTLTPLYIPVSNMLVTAVVAVTGMKPSFHPDPSEVVYIIEAGISSFLRPGSVKMTNMEVRGSPASIKYYDYDGHIIWGATAMILHELVVVLRNMDLPAGV